MQNPSDEIKARLDIVDVIREYIQLKPAGVNFGARCPFHNEKSASFMVSPEKQIWHCFGCGKGGDIFTFIMELEGLSFVEALRELAPKAGIELKKEDPKISSQRNRLLDIMEEAVRFYQRTLSENPMAEPARAYLRKRGLSEQTIEDWRLGLSLDSWDDLTNHLLSKGFRDNEIFLAGLSVKKEGTNRFYNRFRGRIMFPIFDINGNPVAFTARVSPEREATEKMGKYVNSPQTMIYEKSRILFGLDRAKQAIRTEGLAIVVEGQMDVITAHQNGFKNIVASSGTALTEEQVKLIKRYTDNIALAFDADQAGQGAAARGNDQVSQLNQPQVVKGLDRFGREREYIDPALTSAVDLKIIEIPNGKDPDDCIRTAPEEWRKAVAQAKPIMQHYFDKTINSLNIGEVEGKRQATKILLPAISKLGSQIEREAWVRKLGQSLGVSENLLFEAMPKKPAANERVSRQPVPEQKIEAKKSREESMSELLLALTIRFPSTTPYLLNNLQMDQVFGAENKELYKNLVIYYNQINDNWTQTAQFNLGNLSSEEINQVERPSSVSGYQNFKDWLAKFSESSVVSFAAPRGANNKEANTLPVLLDRLAMLAEKEFYTLNDATAKAEAITITYFLKKHYLASQLKTLETRLAASEKQGDRAQVQNLLEEFKILSEELRDLNQL